MSATLCTKNRLPIVGRLVAVLLTFGLFAVELLNGAEPVRDVYRQDVLTFAGTQNASSEVLPSDSFLVTFDCKASVPRQVPTKYSIIIRGVDPLERALLQDAQDGKWDYFDLFRAAMIVEGIRDPEVIRNAENRLNGLVAKVKSELQTAKNTAPQALTQALFEAMHKEILTSSYNLDCTELSKVLKTGQFNCVSATVLFNCLADKAGLNVCALEMPGHALSRVKFDGQQAMNLETTCPTWFALQNNAERLAATYQRVAPVTAETNPMTANNSVAALTESVPELVTELKNLREISPVQLVATIYYNLGVECHAEKRYPEAAAANIKAYCLDPINAPAWGNMMAAINNWALNLLAEKGKERYDVATVLLDQGVQLDPTYANFRENQLYVFYYWIYGLAEKGRFDDARTVFSYANQRLPGDKQLATLMESIERFDTKKVNPSK